MAEKRTYELDTYEQLLPGDVGYIPASSIYVLVDNSEWIESKKMTIDDFFSSGHVESGRYSNIGDRSVAILFDTAFSDVPRDIISVYRIFEPTSGKIIREQVRYYNLNVTTTGFSLEIDANEDLVGVIIDYTMLDY